MERKSRVPLILITSYRAFAQAERPAPSAPVFGAPPVEQNGLPTSWQLGFSPLVPLGHSPVQPRTVPRTGRRRPTPFW